MGTSRRGSQTDSAWKTLVHLAITAGIDHVAHDGCSDRNCRRYHYALDLMHSKDDERAAGRITGRDHDGVLVLVHDVVRCLPIVTPFERDDEDFPATYAALASAWRESVTEAAHAWHETLISCAAAAFEARFPWLVHWTLKRHYRAPTWSSFPRIGTIGSPRSLAAELASLEVPVSINQVGVQFEQMFSRYAIPGSKFQEFTT